MQSSAGHRTPNTYKSILLLSAISLFSCIIGAVLGAGGLWIYQLRTGYSQIASSPISEQPTEKQSQTGTLTEDGLFLTLNGQFQKLPQIITPSQIDFAQIPSTSEKLPTLAIRGTAYPLGNLQLAGYYAGIGVDADFTQAGAVV